MQRGRASLTGTRPSAGANPSTHVPQHLAGRGTHLAQTSARRSPLRAGLRDGAARTGPRSTEPAGQPPCLRTHFTRSRRIDGWHGGHSPVARSVQHSRLAQRPRRRSRNRAQGKDARPWGGLSGEGGAASPLGSSRFGRHRSRWWLRLRWGAGRAQDSSIAADDEGPPAIACTGCARARASACSAPVGRLRSCRPALRIRSNP